MSSRHHNKSHPHPNSNSSPSPDSPPTSSNLPVSLPASNSKKDKKSDSSSSSSHTNNTSDDETSSPPAPTEDPTMKYSRERVAAARKDTSGRVYRVYCDGVF